MKINKLIVAGAAAAMLAVPSTMRGDDPKFMRSSIYTILVNSDEQNTRLDQEAQETDAEGYAATLQESGLSSLGGIPKSVFPTLAIPEQFNDHNLEWRVLDFDQITAGMTDDEAKAARPKGKGGSATGKALLGAAIGATTGANSSTMIRYEKVDDYIFAAVDKFLADNKVADLMVAKWYNYDPNSTPHFNVNLIAERGVQNASAKELEQQKVNSDLDLAAQGFELINNTYVVATNLRFRNNKALAKEISEMVGGAASAAGSNFGALGGLAALGAKKAAEAATNALMKDMYSVTAVTNLYKLDWNDDIALKLDAEVFLNNTKETSLQDLLDAGLCHLTYVGQTKARSGVKKDKTKTLDQLASSATARAIDKALAKLQVENEVFRTIVPISKCEDGYIYAKIGSKEGLTPGDEYEILEQDTTNPKKISYKKIGSAKVEKGGVWFNTTGADEIIANAEEKEAEEMKAAQDLKYSKLKCGKKNDFSGNYLRLAKKKGKIED